MTWSGMRSPSGGEPLGVCSRGKLDTSSRKPVNQPCCRPEDQRRPNPETSAFLCAEPSGVWVCLWEGVVRICSVLLRWEQTQLTASFLAVNTAAPLRHGSGPRTPRCLPSAALDPSALFQLVTLSSPLSGSQTCDLMGCITSISAQAQRWLRSPLHNIRSSVRRRSCFRADNGENNQILQQTV